MKEWKVNGRNLKYEGWMVNSYWSELKRKIKFTRDRGSIECGEKETMLDAIENCKARKNRYRVRSDPGSKGIWSFCGRN